MSESIIMPHPYRITVRSLAPDAAGEPLSFDVINHDEIIGLIDRVVAKEVLPESEVAEFTIGLKLFGEVVLRHRGDPLFAEFFPQFSAFMKRLKKSGPIEPAHP
jgi:hypothetical protein